MKYWYNVNVNKKSMCRLGKVQEKCLNCGGSVPTTFAKKNCLLNHVLNIKLALHKFYQTQMYVVQNDKFDGIGTIGVSKLPIQIHTRLKYLIYGS